MKFTKLLSILVVAVIFTSLMNCVGKETKNATQKEFKKETITKVDFNTQEGYEKVIKDLGITIFDGAVFGEVRKSDFYGNNIVEYLLPVGKEFLFANAKQAEDSLISFYKAQLDSILVPKGWMVSKGGDKNRMMYIKTGKKVKMFTVSIFTTFEDNINKPKKFLFNYSE